MGWTYETFPPRVPGSAGRRASLDAILTSDRYDSEHRRIFKDRVARSAMVGTTYYAAIRREHFDGRPVQVWAAIALTAGRNPRRPDEAWGYKLMDETEGPCEDRCPLSILRLLTPTDYEWANDWRARCYKRHGIDTSWGLSVEQQLLAL